LSPSVAVCRTTLAAPSQPPASSSPAGNGGGFLGPSGDSLEPLDNHTVLVDADTEDDAIGRIRTALEPHDGFGDFTAHQSGAPKGRR
jgi:hypothetical protein